MQLSIFQNLSNEESFYNLYASTRKLVSIENRRFLGNKFKLLTFIKKVIEENCTKVKVICDIFAGTGVVGNYLSRENNCVIFNDILKSCTIPIKAFCTVTAYNREKMENYIKIFNELKIDEDEDNYFSLNFGGKYFTANIARKIGAIRELIGQLDVTEGEKNVLITSLLYAVDKIANTVGHYDAYRKILDSSQRLELKLLNIPSEKNFGNVVYEKDANSLIRELNNIDLIYIDPPYNSRQYSDTYHLLENLVRWEKPEVFGKAAKMDRKNFKSHYCTRNAFNAFQDLINNADCRYILMSYNNTGDKRDARSNNRISHEEIFGALERRGKVKLFEQNYKEFTTGKTILRNDHKETLYLCEVARKD